KTTAAIEYRRTHRNVFYILCSEDMKKSDFVREIAKQVGAPVDGTNLRDILEYTISMIAFLQSPLIIFDEGDKLTDSVFSYFISIYNRLENKSGIVFLSTDYIKRRVESGLRYNKKGYKEINSRIGRKFFDVNVATEQDVYAICQANGLTDLAEIKRVQREAAQGEYDLRRVKRVVHACKRIQEAQRMKGEQA
ncbi:MAG: ATP-binding protein, partial [Bacteroides intestinalis]|nr:ATP-binding protein [Bacteroides intestinalis]